MYKNLIKNMLNPHSIPFGIEPVLPKSFFDNNRFRLVKNLKSSLGESYVPNSFIFMKSQHEHNWNHDDDCGLDNVAEVNFFYLFGCRQYEDMYGIINMDTLEATLSAQDSSSLDRVITNLLHPSSTDPLTVNSDKIMLNSKLEYFFEAKKETLGQIFINNGHLGGSRKNCLVPAFDWLDNFNIEKDTLFRVLHNQRGVKSDEEIEIMKHVTEIAAEAHMFCMKNIRPGMNEFQIARLFNFYSSWRGCARPAYTPIVGSGRNAAILHYNVNNQIMKDGDLV